MSCKCYHADKNFIGGIGVCWGTKECEACSCNGDETKCDFYDYVRKRAKKAITNADRIRGMANEELAEFLQQSGNLDDFPLLKEAADAIVELNKRIDFLMNCIYEAEDSLDRGADNDWARAALEKAERGQDDV